MTRRMIERLSAAALALWALPHPARAEITVDNLLDDMTDLRRLATLPDPPYTTRQFSSWDRKSKAPGNDDWFANDDAGQFLRIEEKAGRREFVCVDTPGPGVIVRMWATENTELDGTIRIYLDESDTPVFETPLKKLLGGTYPGLPRPIAGEYARGWNLYFPIPYARRCKVTSDKPGFYLSRELPHVCARNPGQDFRARRPGPSLAADPADRQPTGDAAFGSRRPGQPRPADRPGG